MISVTIVEIKDQYNEVDKCDETVIVLKAHTRVAPSIMHGESEKDYTKRTKKIFDSMNMFEQLHLGAAKLYQDKPRKFKPAFDEL